MCDFSDFVTFSYQLREPKTETEHFIKNVCNFVFDSTKKDSTHESIYNFVIKGIPYIVAAKIVSNRFDLLKISDVNLILETLKLNANKIPSICERGICGWN